MKYKEKIKEYVNKTFLAYTGICLIANITVTSLPQKISLGDAKALVQNYQES